MTQPNITAELVEALERLVRHSSASCALTFDEQAADLGNAIAVLTKYRSAAVGDEAGLTAYRCIGCKRIETRRTEPEECPWCRCHVFAVVAPSVAPPLDEQGARELVKALEPFAAIASEVNLADHPDSYAPRPSRGRPNMADYRRALRAIQAASRRER